MKTPLSIAARIVPNLVIFIAVLFATRLGVKAQESGTLVTLYNFQGTAEDGCYPDAELTHASDDTFYGTTVGYNNIDKSGGTVFNVTSSGLFTNLHSFSFSDGDGSEGSLAPYGAGTFFGTGFAGGNGGGTIFQITDAGTFTVLYTLGGHDGSRPSGGLLLATDGNFYGATNFGTGTVFRVTPTGSYTVLHTFTTSDGTYPNGGLLQGPDGNIYGTTSGGSTGSGTVFQITTAGTFNTIYSFTGGSDGGRPFAGLVADSAGNFYGTTAYGGSNADPSTGAGGTVFQITSTGVLTTLHSFNGSDGATPTAKLLLAHDGSLYGTTEQGGAYNLGTVFQISSYLSNPVFTSLYAFNGNNGSNPKAGLSQDDENNFYGTCNTGGANSFGTIFKLTVSAVSTPVITSSSAASAQVGTAFSYPITASNSPTSYGASGLPAGLSVNTATGVISGTPSVVGTYAVALSATNAAGTGTATLTLTVATASTATHPPFFNGEVALGNGVYYLAFANGFNFGIYSYLSDPSYIYSFDLGYEYVIDAADGNSGVYFYDFTDNVFLYTSPSFSYPYLYDFSLNAVVYYYQGSTNPRYFFDFASGTVISNLH